MAESKSKLKNEKSSSKIRSFFIGFRNLFGSLALILSLWTAMITGLSIGPSIMILMHADGYKPDTFTIEKLVYFKPRHKTRSSRSSKYFARGTVAGNKEIFKLGSYVKGTPQGIEDLEAQFDEGQKLAVLYNPKVPKGTELRVLYPEKDFHATWKRRQKKMYNTGYFPWLLSMGLCLVFGIIGRKIKSTIGFCLGSFIFVIFAWIPTLLNILF
jgi:hypothetical protein